MDLATSQFGTPLLQRLAASLKGAADMLVIRDPTYVTYFSRFNPYCTSHSVDLVVFPDGKAVLFTSELRSWANDEAKHGNLSPGLQVISYAQHDEGEPSPFLPTLWEHLLDLDGFAKHRTALEQALELFSDKRLAGPPYPFTSLTIAIDGTHILPPKADEIRYGFSGANLIDWVDKIDECKLVMDDFHLNSLIIAVELVEVCATNCFSAIRDGALFTHARDFGSVAMKAYQQEHWPGVDLAGIASRDGFNLDGWNITLTRERALRQTKPVRADPGEPWNLYIAGFVNGMGVEYQCEGGERLSKGQNAASRFLSDLQSRLPSLLKAGVKSQDIHEILRDQLAEGGYEMLNIRPGHGVANPIHDVPTLSSKNRTAFPVGSTVAIEPAIVGHRTSGIIYACKTQTCLMTDQGAQPLNSIKGTSSPSDNDWTIDGVRVGRPNLVRALSYRLDFEKFKAALRPLGPSPD